MIEVEGVTVVYDNEPVLLDINLLIPSNRLIAIVGPNGAGKTTLIKTLLRQIKPVCGYVKFNEDDCIKNKIAYVTQSGTVDWDFPITVGDVVLMGRYGHIGLFKRAKKEDYDKVLYYLTQVGMEDYIDHQISQLSGGQQQRVFLARALVQEAKYYFFDEPFKGIDARNEKILIGILQQLKKLGKTVIVVHHDLLSVRKYFDDVVLLNREVIDYGAVEDVFHNENISKTFHCSDVLMDG